MCQEALEACDGSSFSCRRLAVPRRRCAPARPQRRRSGAGVVRRWRRRGRRRSGTEGTQCCEVLLSPTWGRLLAVMPLLPALSCAQRPRRLWGRSTLRPVWRPALAALLATGRLVVQATGAAARGTRLAVLAAVHAAALAVVRVAGLAAGLAALLRLVLGRLIQPSGALRALLAILR